MTVRFKQERRDCCPRCGSQNPAEAFAVAGWPHYQCRHAWHMPPAPRGADAVAFVAEVDQLFSGDTAPPVMAPDGMSRESTAGYP